MGLFRRSGADEVVASDIEALRASGARFVDVRDLIEWRAGRLSFAEHIPLTELSARSAEIDPERLTVFVCRTGHRSGSATSAFAAHDYKVANLAGGMVACRAAGIEIVADDGGSGMVI